GIQKPGKTGLLDENRRAILTKCRAGRGSECERGRRAKSLSASLLGKEGHMRKAAASLAVRLDGFIADRDGRVGGLRACADAQEDGGYEAFVQTVDTVVMGGRTYRQVTQELSPGVWPYEGLDCRVWTHDSGPPPHAQRIEGNLAAWLHAEKQKPGRDIWLCGG